MSERYVRAVYENGDVVWKATICNFHPLGVYDTKVEALEAVNNYLKEVLPTQKNQLS